MCELTANLHHGPLVESHCALTVELQRELAAKISCELTTDSRL